MTDKPEHKPLKYYERKVMTGWSPAVAVDLTVTTRDGKMYEQKHSSLGPQVRNIQDVPKELEGRTLQHLWELFNPRKDD